MFDLHHFKRGKSLRLSSYDISGRNTDYWEIPAKNSKIIADIKGPGKITHIWMTQGGHYREVLISIKYNNNNYPSVLVPLGDFFCLGHSIVNSFQSFLFSASTANNNKFEHGCALNCYAQMPFKERIVIELINQSEDIHRQYFYVDYEKYDSIEDLGQNPLYFHAEFRHQNPFGGWGMEILVNKPEADIVNKEEHAWKNNYVILDTKGKGHYIGCNMSITNFQGTWWGEGDDMIWVDGYKWPPDLHGTGSEDYFNQAWGMQRNAFMRNGSSIFEADTGGYQTSYNFHIENPVRFEKEIKVTIEHGHGNHLRNQVSSVAYWYAESPTKVLDVPPVEKRKPILKKDGKWIIDTSIQHTTFEVPLNSEMIYMKKRWAGKNFPQYFQIKGKSHISDGEIVLSAQFTKDTIFQ